MAHFAEIDEGNIVVRVLVVPDEEEHRGQDFLADDMGLGGTWIQTSFNTTDGVHALGGTPVRSNFANIGMTYLSGVDAFQQPEEARAYPSWVLNENYVYVPPVAEPDESRAENLIEWNEETVSWDITPRPE